MATREHSMLMHVLHNALSRKRPHNTMAVVDFTLWLIDTLPDHLKATAVCDEVNNLHVDLRTDDKHKTLFVAHVDTVHRTEGKNKIRKTKTTWHAKGDVLGADDGAGVAMLMHMIHDGVPGYYIFTQGEEKGGIGATYLAERMPDLLRQFDRAIAFDRRGIDSVITHQAYGRCCSNEFGTALADALMEGCEHLMMLNDDTGIYTDTAEFVNIIPECTNISVGYDHEHSQQESLNLVHFQQLSTAVLLVDWDNLPVSRDPTQPDPTDRWGMYNWRGSSKGASKSSYSAYDSAWWEEDYAYDRRGYTMYETQPARTFAKGNYERWREDMYDDLIDFKYGYDKPLLKRIAELAYPDDPELALKHMNAKLIKERDIDDFLQCIDDMDETDAEFCLLDLFDMMHVA